MGSTFRNWLGDEKGHGVGQQRRAPPEGRTEVQQPVEDEGTGARDRGGGREGGPNQPPPPRRVHDSAQQVHGQSDVVWLRAGFDGNEGGSRGCPGIPRPPIHGVGGEDAQGWIFPEIETSEFWEGTERRERGESRSGL